jgi:hypothetical protein
VNQFARDAELYELFRFLNKDENSANYAFPNYDFNLTEIFGAANLSVLSAQRIVFTTQGIQSTTGAVY